MSSMKRAKVTSGASSHTSDLQISLARDLLSVPASTVTSEAAFSAGGRVVSEKRAALSPNTIEALVYLKDWSLADQRKQEIAREEEDVEELMNIKTARPDWMAGDENGSEPQAVDFIGDEFEGPTNLAELGAHSGFSMPIHFKASIRAFVSANFDDRLFTVFYFWVGEDETYWRQKKGDEYFAWPCDSADVLSQLTESPVNAMVGPRSWFGGLFSRAGLRRGSEKFRDYPFSPLQEQRLQKLKDRLQVLFNETNPDHQEALRELWHMAFPDVALTGLISDQWKDMGWQGANPSTDFRGCGFVSLENLLFFARNYPDSFHRLLFKLGGERATWEYPFAVAGINISFMLIQMLDLLSAKPKSIPGINFVKLLGENEKAFDILYCVAFELMDAQWLAMEASYMEFNEVLQVTRMQLERELALEDLRRIVDLPAYNLLYH
ncbi:unnamed protein product [Rhodiola kirilowii]